MEVRMSSLKKRLTKKEQKALNHAKLVSSRKGHDIPSQQNNNVLQFPLKTEASKKVA
jgi:hypothetical protein